MRGIIECVMLSLLREPRDVGRSVDRCVSDGCFWTREIQRIEREWTVVFEYIQLTVIAISYERAVRIILGEWGEGRDLPKVYRLNTLQWR